MANPKSSQDKVTLPQGPDSSTGTSTSVTPS
jgi:hypothetical protein